MSQEQHDSFDICQRFENHQTVKRHLTPRQNPTMLMGINCFTEMDVQWLFCHLHHFLSTPPTILYVAAVNRKSNIEQSSIGKLQGINAKLNYTFFFLQLVDFLLGSKTFGYFWQQKIARIIKIKRFAEF